MTFLNKYLDYWPILAGGLCFLLNGLWLYLVSERGMERSPKPITWVQEYRKPGFPLRAEVLQPGPFQWLSFAAAVAGSLLLAAYFMFTEGKLLYGVWTFEIFRGIRLLQILISVSGAAAVYLILWILFGGWVTPFLGAVLFAACPLYGHIPACLLAWSLLFLLLYLREEKAGFPAELLYLASILFYSLAAAAAPALIWLIPLMIGVHFYKLFSLFRQERLSLGILILLALLALLCWAVFFCFACVLQMLILFGLPLRFLPRLLIPHRILRSCGMALRKAVASLFPRFGRDLLLYPLLDAPLAGLGLFGCLSAGGMAIKRRNARGTFSLIVLGALVVLWLVTGQYFASLGFCLTLGCLLKNSELGDRREQAFAVCLAGALFECALALAAWMLPLPAPLLYRMF